ncbi:hypothetical protein Poli38472_000181 [Pythium oligandrum]|uniref:Uncharacterized protein n=1 Tax=Pythium oligandrum TaxID=41045 RepID=A0A8K1CBS7_PYTOL|nr:hypothetical protein Poli38472_000181 [Pythium oligandrum]|eukprot:TMW60139.1 hypothetical protein Poli38472_000181 [Pythium oligandrum]
MLRRLIRARRLLPAQSVGQENYDRRDPGKEGQPTPDVYHACINSDGPIPLFPEDLSRQRLKKPRFHEDTFRRKARNYITHVNQEERNAAQAWSRLRQLYSVFQVVQAAKEHEGSDEPEILVSDDTPDSVIQDFQELTADLPEGFTSQMFAQLGDALYSEMVATQQQHIGSDAFETLGDQLYSQSTVIVSA